MTAAKWTLGIDLGTSAVKVAVIGADEGVLGEGAAEFDTVMLAPHQAEQAPDDWLAATARAMHGLAVSLGREPGYATSARSA